MQSESQQRKRFLFLTVPEWATVLPLSVFAVFVAFTFTSDISPWISVAVGITVLAIGHMALASQRFLALPQIAIIIAALQYVLAAWLGYYWPPTNPSYDIGLELPKYLSYVGPALCLSVIGWALALVGLPTSRPAQPKPTPALLLELDMLALVGLAALGFGNLVHVEGLTFVVLLLSNLRYVGVFGRMLLHGSGWSWRLAVILSVEVLFAAGGGMFHDLLLWTMWAFAVWAFSFTPRPSWILAVLLLGMMSLPALQEAKWRLRENPSADDPWATDEIEQLSGNPLTRAQLWLKYLGSDMWHTATGDVDPQFLADIAVRYNQGWIVNKLMSNVPDLEPFAEGETIKDSAIDAFVPRLLFPEKGIAGGRYLMSRYAGMYTEGTSMNVGYMGEMYINFGVVGGILGCGVYTLVLGLLFRLLFQWGSKRPLLLAFLPFVFYAAVKSEEDTGFIMNWTVKAAVVAFGIYTIFPAFNWLSAKAGRAGLLRIERRAPVS